MKRKILIISLVLVSMMFFVMCLPDGGGNGGDTPGITYPTELDEDFQNTETTKLPADWVGGLNSSAEHKGKVGVLKESGEGTDKFLAVLDNVLANKAGEADYGKNETGSAWASFPLKVVKKGTLTFKATHGNTDESGFIDPKDKAQFFINLDPSTLKDSDDPTATPDWENSGSKIIDEEVTKVLEPGTYWLTWRAEKKGTDYLEDLFHVDDVKFTPESE